MCDAMFDMHCHLGFPKDGESIACRAAESLTAFSATVDPLSYEKDVRRFSSCSSVRVGLGLHPWFISDDDAQIERFEAIAPSSAFIGEVGLDFSPRHEETRERQVEIFERIVAACAKRTQGLQPRVCSGEGSCANGLVSIHAVRAVDEVIDAFERAGALRGAGRRTPALVGGRALVLHSFAGTSDQLQRALDRGFFVSFGPRVMRTKRGRAYARAVPEDRLLIETDLPSGEGAPFSLDQWSGAMEETWEAVLAARFGDASTEEACCARWACVKFVNEQSARILCMSPGECALSSSIF